MNEFKDLRMPRFIERCIKKDGIKHPSEIQKVCLPIVLQGRDLLAISKTGTGKTLIFILRGLLISYQEQLKLRINEGEGPFVIILCPSHELAIQTFEKTNQYVEQIMKDKENSKYELNNVLCVGGIDSNQQVKQIQKGVHIIVATPGRLSDLINKKKIQLNQIKLLVIDEAERMLELSFQQELNLIINSCKVNNYKNHQMIMLSSTMARSIQDLTQQLLQDGVKVVIGRSGQVNRNVVQNIEYVKQENKLPQILEALKKTGPPVLIFSESKNDVDDINEYLLIKGILCQGLHGGKTQQERQQAIKSFKNGSIDVLIATDVAAKGLDFQKIQHVINFDMPKEIENYVHRIGRTGRTLSKNSKGYSTTFVNKNQDQNILLDLKHLIEEADQPVPQFLKMIDTRQKAIECLFCGGLGHNIISCNKLESFKNKANANSSITNEHQNRFYKTNYGPDQ